MKRWRSELAVALVAALAAAAYLQYVNWRTLSKLELLNSEARERLAELAPIKSPVDAYESARSALQVRIELLREGEPGRWRLWGEPPAGAADIPLQLLGDQDAPDDSSSLPRVEERPASVIPPIWGERLADLTLALSRGPQLQSLWISSGRLDASFNASSADSVEATAGALRERGLVDAFTIAQPQPESVTLQAILNATYSTARADR